MFLLPTLFSFVSLFIFFSVLFNFSPIEVEDVADKQVIFLGKGRKNRKRGRNKMWIFMEKRKKNIKRGRIVRLNIFVIFYRSVTSSCYLGC